MRTSAGARPAGPKGARISGTILDAAGRPLPGARLFFGASDLPLECVTGPGGEYESPDLRPGKVPVFITHPEHQPESRLVSVSPPPASPEGGLPPSAPEARLDAKLATGEKLVVRARTAAGAPIPDAEVWIRLEEGAPAYPTRDRFAASGGGRLPPPVLFAPILPTGSRPPGPEEWRFLGRTGDLGVLETRRAPGRRASVQARVAGFREEVRPVHSSEVALILEPAPAIRGHAVHAATGLPVALTAVRLEMLGGAEFQEAPDRGKLFQSLSPGKLVVGLPPYPGVYRVRASGEGGLQGVSGEVRFDGKTPELDPIVVPLEPRMEVGGTVSGPQGPLPRTPVDLLRHDPLGPRFRRLHGILVPAPAQVVREARADERGAFGFTDVAPGTYRLRARSEGLGELLSSAFEVPRDGEHAIALRKGSILSGTLFDPEGLPEPNIPILLTRGEDSVWVAWTDSGGRFELRDLPPSDDYRIHIGDPAGPTSDAIHREILLEEGSPGAPAAPHGLSIEEGRQVTFDLHRPPSPFGSIEGRLEVDGAPAAGIDLRLRRIGEEGPGTSPELEARTDARGEFRLRGILPGDYALSTAHHQPRAVRVEAGRRTRTEVSLETFRYRLEILDRATGERFRRACDVEIKRLGAPGEADDAAGGRTVLRGVEDGLVEVAGLVPGAHRVRVKVRGIIHDERRVEILADVEERVAIEETDDVSIHLLVSESEPFRGRATVVLFKDGREVHRGLLEIDGVVTVPTAGPGEYELHVRSDDRSAKVAFSVVKGEPAGDNDG